MSSDRIQTALKHTDTALRELRRTAFPGALSGEMALIWRYRLGPVERAFLLSAAAQAAESEYLEKLGFVLGGPPPFGDV